MRCSSARSGTDAVALIRSPLMVVKHYRHWQVGNPVVAGAFIAADDIDDILRVPSEPPTHDRWDPASRRLQDETGPQQRYRPKGPQRDTASPEALSERSVACRRPRDPLSVLERMLASFFSGKSGGGGVDHSPAPISLSYEARSASQGRSWPIDFPFQRASTFALRLMRKCGQATCACSREFSTLLKMTRR